jgi:hypothetical protein
VQTTADRAAAGTFRVPALFKSGGAFALLAEADLDGRYAAGSLTHAAGSGTYGSAAARPPVSLASSPETMPIALVTGNEIVGVIWRGLRSIFCLGPVVNNVEIAIHASSQYECVNLMEHVHRRCLCAAPGDPREVPRRLRARHRADHLELLHRRRSGPGGDGGRSVTW